MWRQLLLLTASVAIIVVADLELLDNPTAQHLQIHNDHIVSLKFGVPGKWLRFRVRDDTPNIYVFQHPSPYSDTWTSTATRDNYGQAFVRDTLGVGTIHMRADVIVGRFAGETPATVEGIQAEGVLGLSALSPLWLIWRNLTRTRDSLYLGNVLARVSDDSPIALSAALLPSWLYGTSGYPRSFVAEYRATLDQHSIDSLRKSCLANLGDVVDESVDLAGSGDTLADVLGVDAGEQLCQVSPSYRLLLVPESDYNVVPPELLMHPRNQPPMFRIESVLADDVGHMQSVLFNRFEDGYVEMDTTNAAGAGIRRAANRPAAASMIANKTIVLGYGMRRFETTYLLDEERAFITVRHNALSLEGQRRTTEQSVEVRRIRDISALIAGILLFALVAIEPDPVLPQHPRQELEKYAHAQHTSTGGGGALTLESKSAPQVTATNASHRPAPTSETRITKNSDGSLFFHLDETPPASAVAPGESEAPAASDDLVTRALQNNAFKSGLRAAALQAAWSMECQWPVDVESLMFVQLIIELVVALYFTLALAFYDTRWALSLVLVRNVTSDTLGWLSIAFLVLGIVAFSIIASFSAGRDARLGSIALQMEILSGLYVLLISLYQWDLALALMLALIVGSGIVLFMLLMTAADVMPQYKRSRISALHTKLLPIAVFAAVPWLFYIVFGLLPFIVSRLWDNETHSMALSIYTMFAVVLVAATYLSVQPFAYPLILVNASLDEIIAGYNARWSQLTGRPVTKD